jgi:hypothetical protein
LLTTLLFTLAMATPKHLQHQGRLIGATGSPLEGSVDLTFTLWDAPTGGTSLHTEVETVQLTDGYFSVALGDSGGNPIDDTDLAVEDLWIEVGLPGGTNLSRMRVASVPFARNGGGAAAMVARTANYTIPSIEASGAHLFTNEGATAAITFTLPPAEGGRRVTIVRSTNQPVTVSAASGDTIQGSSSVLLNNQYDSTTLYAVNAATWVQGEGQAIPTSAAAGSAVYTCTGQDQTFTVPTGVTSLRVKLWGAGGAGASVSWAGAVGGGGGYTEAVLTVTPGQTLTMIAGCGGTIGNDQASGGGGRSAIRLGSTELVTAGGGGGAGYNGSHPGGAGGGAYGVLPNSATHGYGGGAGTPDQGGQPGGHYNGCTVYGTGPAAGTQFAGGRGNGTSNGSVAAYGGGAPGGVSCGSGGGGGGWYGGGGGGSTAGGGGGSGYGPSGSRMIAGTGQQPGNAGDAERWGAGVGGSQLQAGATGMVRLAWGPSIPPPSTSSNTWTCTGQDQPFVVPAGVTSIAVKMWGAGGAGSGVAWSGANGGGGGYASANLTVTPGETLVVMAGCPGTLGADQASGGGGRSAIRRGGADLLTAGGGGGAGYNGAHAGGAGGGSAGVAGTNGTHGTGGGGGTTSGGAAGSHNNGCVVYGAGPAAGTLYTGGRGNGTANGSTTAYGGGAPGGISCGSGGGGGGYYGGGGGGSTAGGGGGSGFGPVDAVLTPGSGSQPGNASDPERGTSGNGGATLQMGQTGLVKISW